MARLLFVPGLGNSGPDHWQSWWQAQEFTATRVEQEDWQTPDLEQWSARVSEALDRSPDPAWIVAHSFGCLASIRAVAHLPGKVLGALLVASAEPDRFEDLGRTLMNRLPAPSRVVASATDPWMSLYRAKLWSTRWGSDFVSLGAAGHINAESGYGPWSEGKRLLGELQTTHTPLASEGRCCG